MGVGGRRVTSAGYQIHLIRFYKCQQWTHTRRTCSHHAEGRENVMKIVSSFIKPSINNGKGWKKTSRIDSNVRAPFVCELSTKLSCLVFIIMRASNYTRKKGREPIKISWMVRQQSDEEFDDSVNMSIKTRRPERAHKSE